MESQTTETRSEEVQEILSYSPNWITRWGIVLVFMIVVSLLVASWFIRYPDVIPARITITDLSPSVSLVARSSGKLILFVKEGDDVRGSANVAAIENPASIQDVFELERELDSFKIHIADPESARIEFARNLDVGELQSDYSIFLQSCIDYKSFVQAQYHAKKAASIQTQISYCQDLATKLMDQQKILEREVELDLQKHNKNKILFEKNLISQVELVSSENEYLTQKYTLETAKSNIISNNIQQKEYEKAILDLNQQFHDTRKTLLVSLQESFKKLMSQIAAWEQRYILKSPIDGRVSFFKFWNTNQFVNAGNEIMVILPTLNTMIGRIFLPQSGTGKIRLGQRVRIELDNYPYHEFGVVFGEIALISPISRENQYSVTVSLPDGLHTSYNKNLEFKDEMQGSADIITEDLRLLQRLFNQVNSLLKNST